MTTNPVPLAPRDGRYHCTGCRPQYTKLFHAGEPLNHGPDCESGSLWLYCPTADMADADLVTVSIDLDCLPEGLYLKVDDLFSTGDTINLKIGLDSNFAGLSDGAYRILASEEEGDSFHFKAEKVGHKYWDPQAPLYHASSLP